MVVGGVLLVVREVDVVHVVAGVSRKCMLWPNLGYTTVGETRDIIFFIEINLKSLKIPPHIL